MSSDRSAQHRLRREPDSGGGGRERSQPREQRAGERGAKRQRGDREPGEGKVIAAFPGHCGEPCGSKE
jgi:hypothetical protein